MPKNEISKCYLTSNKQKINFFQRKIVLIYSLGIISMILLTIPAYADLNKSNKYLFDDVVVLQVGSDQNTKLAVKTFLKVYPSDDCVKVINVKTENELFFWLLTPVHASHIIFGHGSKEGLITEEKVISWNILKLFINTNKKNFVPVMACYSGLIVENYGGVSFEFDAEAAGIYGAYYIDIDRHERSTIGEELLSIAALKQTLNNHPLSNKMRRWVLSPAAGTMEVINLKL